MISKWYCTGKIYFKISIDSKLHVTETLINYSFLIFNKIHASKKVRC